MKEPWFLSNILIFFATLQNKFINLAKTFRGRKSFYWKFLITLIYTLY